MQRPQKRDCSCVQGFGIESNVTVVSEQTRMEVKTSSEALTLYWDEKLLGLKIKSNLILCTLLETLCDFWAEHRLKGKPLHWPYSLTHSVAGGRFGEEWLIRFTLWGWLGSCDQSRKQPEFLLKKWRSHFWASDASEGLCDVDQELRLHIAGVEWVGILIPYEAMKPSL